MTLSPYEAFVSECVTCTMVVPSAFRRRNSSMISRPWSECRLPVGSSASRSRGFAATARAIVASPKVILADEPTGNLHSAQGREIMELFKRLNAEGTTIVQVTHSDVNASYGHRVIQLRDGWIVQEDGDRAVGVPQ